MNGGFINLVELAYDNALSALHGRGHKCLSFTQNRKGGTMFTVGEHGGEFDFSKVFRVGSPPSRWIYLNISLEWQGRGGV